MLNLGPQHPAVHGVLRLLLEINNEQILKVNPEIGYLHHGTEKLCEYNEYYKITPFFDRFDYTGLILCEHSYILSVEHLLNNNVPLYIQVQRIVLNEIMRISSHFLALVTGAMNLGAVTPFLWMFEEREEILTLFEDISGARMHTALFTKGSLNYILTYKNILFLYEILQRLNSQMDKLYELLTNSSI